MQSTSKSNVRRKKKRDPVINEVPSIPIMQMLLISAVSNMQMPRRSGESQRESGWDGGLRLGRWTDCEAGDRRLIALPGRLMVFV